MSNTGSVQEDELGAVVTHVPNERHSYGLFRTWKVMYQNIYRSRPLIWQLFRRDFVAMYRKSFIGFTWIFVTPILGVVSWILMQRSGLLSPGETEVPYPVYVLVGSSIFGLFLELFKGASQTLLGGSSLIMQVNYPREALLFQQLANQLARFLISLCLNIVVIFAFGSIPSLTGLLLFPFVVMPLVLLAAALGLITSMFAVVAVDLSNTITMAMSMLLYVTPVIFKTVDYGSFIGFVSRWNPLTYLVCSARDMLLFGNLYSSKGYAICASISVALFLLSWRVFFVSEQRLVERVM